MSNLVIADMPKLNLGCGRFPLPGWINLDAEGHAGVEVADLTKPLTFADNSISLIRSEHFLEHINLDEARALLLECKRVLVPNGKIRISVPSLDTAIEDYAFNNLTRGEKVGISYRSKCLMLNMAFTNWGHKYMYDKEELTWLLTSAGFHFITQHRPRESSVPEFCCEIRADLGELVLEAFK